MIGKVFVLFAVITAAASLLVARFLTNPQFYTVRDHKQAVCVDCGSFAELNEQTEGGGVWEFVDVVVADGVELSALRNKDWAEDWEVVVFVHGFPDNVQSFTNQMVHFHNKQMNVASIPLRGYSQRSFPQDEDFTVLRGASDLERVISTLSPNKPVHLVGHDWGAALSFHLAQQQPSLLRSLTMVAVPNPNCFATAALVSPSQFLSSWYMLFFQLPSLPERWLSGCQGVKFLWNTWSPTAYSANRLQSVCNTLSSDVTIRGALGWYRSNVRATIEKLRKLETFTTNPIRVKTLGIAGSEDGCITLHTFKRCMIQDHFPSGLKVVEMHSSGHFPHHDNPHKFNQILEDFIRGI